MTIVHKQLGIAAVAVAATALVFGASFALAQTAAELEAELNAASAQIDNNTSFDVNVKALGTQADVSAQVGVNTDAQTEYANLFGSDNTMTDDSMQSDTMMEADADTDTSFGASVSAFFSAVFDFFFGWL